jgi:hypothetical protein
LAQLEHLAFLVNFRAVLLAKKADLWFTAWGDDTFINLWRWTDVL